MSEEFLRLVDPGSSGAAVARAATAESEWVVFVREDALLPGAAARLDQLLREVEADVVYVDSALGSVAAIQRRPEPSPERLRNQYFWGPLVAYRTAELRALRTPDLAEGAELYQLALRATARGLRITRFAEALTLERKGSPTDASNPEATRTALDEHLAATGGGRVVAVGDDGVHDTRRAVIGEPLVSIVIPSRGTWADAETEPISHLLDAVASIVGRSTYRNFEIIVVLDEVAAPGVVERLGAIGGDQLRILWWRRPFNFSEKINAGVIVARGEYVLILNDDVLVLNDDWIEPMLALAQLPGAGMAGALLYYEDDSIQHAGHHYFELDVSHIGLDAPRGDAGPLRGYRVEREAAGVTAACAVMRRDVYLEVGGMSNLLPGNFNDVDLCLKVTGAGYTIYWTPHSELYHFESKSRDASVHAFEVSLLWNRWGNRLHSPEYWPYPHSRKPTPAYRPGW